MADDSVGGRMRRLRRLRGLTQEALAARAHFSASLVRKVEQGTVPPSAAFVAGCARALGVKMSFLYGTEERDVAEQPQAEIAGITELRQALDAFDDPQPDDEPLSLPYIYARLTELSRRTRMVRFADAVGELPRLLHHLHALADAPGAEGVRARVLLHDAYRLAASVAGQFRALDLAAIASERHIILAPNTGDPLRVAVSTFHRSTRALQNGDYRAGLRLLDRARQNLDDSDIGRGLGAQLALRAGVLAARSGDLPEADGWIREARALITTGSVPAEPFHGLDASPINLFAHWCAAPVEIGDGAEAVRRANSVKLVDPDRPERVGHHHIDMARAHFLAGDRRAAVTDLNAARRVDPYHTRRHPAVRETVLAIAEADRRATDSLAGFARWVGIELS
ncbi:multiprotein-bridging factor 1 family protein [Microlunatus sp. GCM10028923]|uniref:helix-turn-helix domain-containing protein n=1 Tax=Microlunatus sp. GCM10028923 TaxID=3273400 RepID=UPI003617A8ED